MPKNVFYESFDFGFGDVLPAGRTCLRRSFEGLRHLIATHWWCAADHQPSHSRKAWNQLDADMSAERPTKHDGLGHSQFMEQLDGSVCKSGPRVAAVRTGGVAGLPVPR